MANTTAASTPVSTTEPKSNVKIRFAPNSEFEKELSKRVNAFFEDGSNKRRDLFNMYLKSFRAISWVIISYCLIVIANLPLWGIILASLSLGLALNALSFNVMHDAIHGAYSRHKIVNRLMGHWLDHYRRQLIPLENKTQLLPSFIY